MIIKILNKLIEVSLPMNLDGTWITAEVFNGLYENAKLNKITITNKEFTDFMDLSFEYDSFIKEGLTTYLNNHPNTVFFKHDEADMLRSIGIDTRLINII